MLIDGRLIPSGVSLRSEVVVIGSGPAGITIALELEAAGVDVALIESGGQHHSRTAADALAGRSTGEPFPLAQSRLRGFGGTSGLWQRTTGLRARPLDEIDFRARPGRSDAAWPFSLSTLVPYYRRAHALVGLQDEYAPDEWRGSTHPHPLTWDGGPGMAMFQFAPHDTFLRRFDDVIGTPGIDLYLHSTVDDIELADDGESVTSVSVVCRGGNRFRLGAKLFVLAAGTIENARVLLSSPGRGGNGVGNEHDLVGRYFMEHPSMDCGVLDTTAGTFDVSLFAEKTDESGRKSQAMLRLDDATIEREGLLNAAFWVFDVPASYLSSGVSAARSFKAAVQSRSVRHAVRDAGGMLRGAPGLAMFALDKVRRRGASEVGLRILSEQLPDRESRVRLLDTRDDLGLRRVSLDWRVSPTDFEMMRRHREVLGDLFETHGVARFREPFDPASRRSPLMSNHHHLGTTRMHVDPQHGVVDEHCRVHSTKNLYAAGSSVFPTGGFLNPTLTIIALAQRLADHLRHELAPTRLSPASE